MKEYNNGRKATEFGKSQVGAIYANAKKGSLKIERWAMSFIYDLADFYGFDDNRNVERRERSVLAILADVREGRMEDAQAKIDAFSAEVWEDMGRKFHERANHALVA